MADVIDINKGKKVEILSGMCRCLVCKHEFHAEHPVGTVKVNCPACSGDTGRAIGTVDRGGLHWHCNCGNDVFYICPKGPYCVNCGEFANGWI